MTTLNLDEYELRNLYWLILSIEDTYCNGDWHCQIRWKIREAIGLKAWPLPGDRQAELDEFCRVIKGSPNEQKLRPPEPPSEL